MRLEGKWMKEFILTATGAQYEEILGYAYVKRWHNKNYVVIIDNCVNPSIQAYIVDDTYYLYIDSIFDDNRSYHLSYQADAIFIEPAECFIIKRCCFIDSLLRDMDVHLIEHD